MFRRRLPSRELTWADAQAGVNKLQTKKAPGATTKKGKTGVGVGAKPISGQKGAGKGVKCGVAVPDSGGEEEEEDFMFGDSDE